MRVAYYYHQAERKPLDAPYGNPYGELLCQALERANVGCEFTIDIGEEYLRRNQGRIQVLHLNWPHFDYFHEDAGTMQLQMLRFVKYLELARELGYRLVWTAQNIYPHNTQHRAIDHECRLAICRLATAIIVHCDFARRELMRNFGRVKNVFVIPHGHYHGIYSQPGTREEVRVRLGVPQDAFVYGFFGSFQPYKGIEGMLRCFKLLPENSWLLGAGGGKSEYLDCIRHLVAGEKQIKFRMSAYIPFDEIALVLEASDVIVLPFAATMTSGSAILALSWPRALVAPALGCLPEMVPATGGILYDPLVADGLFDALTRIRSIDLQAASQAGVAAVKRLDWDMIGVSTLGAYNA